MSVNRMIKKLLRVALSSYLALGIAVFASQSYAQMPQAKPFDGMVDASSRTQIVNALADALVATYVFPDVADTMAKAIRQKLKDGGYDSVNYAVVFSTMLTTELNLISHDLHLKVGYSTYTLPVRAHDNIATAAEEASLMTMLRVSSFGVEAVKTLPGNIGYLQLTLFAPAKYSKKAIATAMAQLANSDALIIDLSKNDGGAPDGVALVSSYLFDKRTHINDLYWREGARTQEFWTDEKVSGPKFGQSKPVYVLMGPHTLSAGEEFGYNLQSLKRATIVGEVTWGGAHHTDYPQRLNDYFYADIPMARAVNPITKTNWEGTGVKPDVPTASETALLVAQRLAVQTLSATEKNATKQQALQARLGELDLQSAPAKLPIEK